MLDCRPDTSVELITISILINIHVINITIIVNLIYCATLNVNTIDFYIVTSTVWF